MNPKMMNSKLFEPRRLRESTARPSSAEGRLARQLRLLSDAAPVPQMRRHSTLPRHRRYVLIAARFAAVALLVLAVTGVASAAAYVVRRVWPSPTAVDHASDVLPATESPPRTQAPVARPLATSPQRGAEPTLAPAASSAPRPFVPAAPTPRLASTGTSPRMRPTSSKSDDPAAPNPAPEQDLASPASRMQAPALALPATSPVSNDHGVPMPARTDGLSEEASLLRQALSALRRERAPRRALALLDEYDRRFGHGVLGLEATSARAQALLKLGDHTRALALLDRLPLSHDGHTGELRVIRGELRSLSNRCQDALGDFDAVLRATKGIDRDEVARALFGRASCRMRTGDAAGAERDRQRYLREFPEGPAVKQLLSQP